MAFDWPNATGIPEKGDPAAANHNLTPRLLQSRNDSFGVNSISSITGSLTRLSSLDRTLETPIVHPAGSRTAPSTPLKQSGLQWLPLSVGASQNKGADDMQIRQAVETSKPIIPSVYTPVSSATLPRSLMKNSSSDRGAESGRVEMPFDVTDHGVKGHQSVYSSSQDAKVQGSIYSASQDAKVQGSIYSSGQDPKVQGSIYSSSQDVKGQGSIYSTGPNVKSQQSVYLTGQNISSTLSQTLPRGFGASKDVTDLTQPTTTSIYAPKRFVFSMITCKSDFSALGDQ